MDPLPIASGFATIVSLIGMYRAERRANEAASYEDFVAWLRTSRHDKIVELLADNAQLAASTKEVLTRQHDEVMDGIAGLERMMTDLGARFELFAPLAQALSAQSSISDQVVSILRQMNQADARRFLAFTTRGGLECMYLDGVEGGPDIEEPRFLEDDLDTLVGFGLLMQDWNESGDPIYIITRSGALLGNQ